MDRERLAEDLFRNLNQGRTERLAVTGGNQKTNEGLKQKFIRLEQLKKKEMSKWWDGATFRQYKKLNRIPRGLRSNIFPTYDNLDVDLLKRWEEELNSSSFKLIDILIENADRQVSKLLIEIQNLEKEILELNLKVATEKNYEILNDIILKLLDLSASV